MAAGNNELTDKEKEQYKAILLDFVPKDGTAIGNMSARSQLIQQINQKFEKTISDDDYWTIRNSLIADGKITQGQGRGGSIVLVNATIKPESPKPTNIKYNREADLYPPLHKTIIESWVKEYQIKAFIPHVTAMAGKKDTGGPWTRPDISLFAVRTYPYIPGKSIELITFEIKPLNSTLEKYIAGVFETASHSAFAHRSYLMVHVIKDVDEPTKKLLERLEKEAQRMKVGFVTFEDPENYDTFTVQVEAALRKPDPENLCKFIMSQFPQDKKDRIQELAR